MGIDRPNHPPALDGADDALRAWSLFCSQGRRRPILKKHQYLTIAALTLLSVPLAAQPTGRSDPGTYRSEVRLQGWVFENFFQLTDPALTQDVSALGTELRSAFQPREAPFELYAHVNYLLWDDIDRKNAYGGRIGAARDGEIHDFNVFLARSENRASLDIGDVVATADVATFAGEYSYRIGDWQIGAESLLERHRFEALPDQDSDYTVLGASVRYRGFGWKYSPRVGFTTSRRDSDDGNESYEEPAWYIQFVFVPHPRVYASIRYRDRERRYTSAGPADSNFGRVDDRPDWSSYGSVRLTERFSGTWYYANQSVTSSRPRRDFDSSLLILGLVMRF